MIPFALTLGGFIFHAGQQSEKIDELFTRMDANTVEQKSTREILHGIETKLVTIEQDIKHILIDMRKNAV